MKKVNEEVKTIKQFIITLVIVALVVVGIYFFTIKVVKKDSTAKEDDTTQTSVVNTSNAIVGNMLKKSDKLYYVIIYDTSKDDAATYTRLVSDYKSLDEHSNVYTVDLSNALNAKYYSSEETNCNTSDINEMKFGDITVLKITNGNVNKCFTDTSKIKKEWKIS